MLHILTTIYVVRSKPESFQFINIYFLKLINFIIAQNNNCPSRAWILLDYFGHCPSPFCCRVQEVSWGAGKTLAPVKPALRAYQPSIMVRWIVQCHMCLLPLKKYKCNSQGAWYFKFIAPKVLICMPIGQFDFQNMHLIGEWLEKPAFL